MSSSAVPIYFETSWSILSTIGLIQAIFGGIVVGLTGLSGLSLLPIIIAVACAIANGMCYYAFYNTNYALHSRMAASGIADVMWLIQEAGLSFYSYQILSRILRNKAKIIFTTLFWFIMIPIAAMRMCILVFRLKDLSANVSTHQTTINSFHIGYFTAIALCECLSSFFLLQSFFAAHKSAKNTLGRSSVTAQLIRSTEARIAALALVGVSRAITYSYQQQAQAANTTPSQVDRFVYTVECMFPFIMIIDLLAARLARNNGTEYPSKSGRPTQRSFTRPPGNHPTELDSMTAEDRNITRHREIIMFDNKNGSKNDHHEEAL